MANKEGQFTEELEVVFRSKFNKQDHLIIRYIKTKNSNVYLFTIILTQSLAR